MVKSSYFYLADIQQGRNMLAVSRCTEGKHSWNIVCASTDDITDKFKKNMGTLADNGNIIVSKNCKFPRYRMKNTPYKKVMDTAKSDAVIYNPKVDFRRIRYAAPALNDACVFRLNNSGSIVIIPSHIMKSHATLSYVNVDNAVQLAVTVIKSCNHNYNLYIASGRDGNHYYSFDCTQDDVEFLYRGPVATLSEEDYDIVSGVMCDRYTNLVKESTFIKALDKYLPKINMGAIEGVIEYLNSSDKDTRLIGWKTLESFNVTEHKHLIATVIMMNVCYMPWTVFDSVGMRMLYDTLGINKDLCNPRVYKTLDLVSNYLSDHKDELTEYEKSAIPEVISSSIKNNIINLCESYKNKFASLNMTYNLDIGFDV